MCNRKQLSQNKNSIETRSFVLHKNDSGISADREIKVIDNKNRLSDDQPLVSIIIPTYDAYRDGLFPELLKQLSNQTFQYFEHIIVDGNSNDNTVNILKKFEKTYDLIWVSENDDGIAEALNKGLNLARGKYIYVLGADDFFIDSNILSNVFG